MRGDASGPLPEQHAQILARKLADEQLVLFAGAGISHLARDKDGRRLPLWKELAEEVAEACHEDLAAYGGNILDLFDAIKLGQSRFTLEEAVRAALDDAVFVPSPAHQALAELPWASVYTTNYDGLLGQALRAKDKSNASVWDPVSEEDQYDRMRRPAGMQPRLFHVHGTLAKPHTRTRADYRLWPEKHPRAFRDLEQVILSKTVLFVGYSLSDPHLDGLLPIVRKITEGRRERHYAWMWKVPHSHVQLLDRSDKIEAISIERDEDWLAAFSQLGSQLPRIRPPSVFIFSYSHDSEAHNDRVLQLADHLRRDGVDAVIDRYEISPPEGWPVWIESRIRDADFVLMVCTETYSRRVMGDSRRVMGDADRGRGTGVLLAMIIRRLLYDTGRATVKFVPVLFSQDSAEHIPRPLRSFTSFFVDTVDGSSTAC